MNSQYLKKIKLPDSPGVYLFRKIGQILYIGKATSLKNRVRSYFTLDLIEKRSPLIADMVFKADKIDFIKTDSVLESLILEASLIKKHQPKYNTKEKDDRSYNYVVITKEDFPKVLIERGRNLKANSLKLKATYGPFTNGTQLKEALKIVRKIFPFLDNYSNKTGYGFYREIGLAPEILNIESKKEYAKTIKNIKLFFEGKKKSILKNLEKEMKTLAKNHEFEKADKVKKTIFALNHIQDVALIKEDYLTANSSKLEANFRIEAYDVAHISGTNTVGVMVVLEDGKPSKNEYRKFKIQKSTQNDVAGLKEILERRLNHSEWQFPNFIIVDGAVAQKNIAEKVLQDAGLKIPVIAVTKDERHRPKTIQGREDLVEKYKKEILLANSEAHRFAIKYHKNLRGKNLLP